MTETMNRLGIIFNPKFIILFYLGWSISIFAYSVLVLKQYDMNVIYARLGFLTMYSILAVLGFRGRRAAIWIIAVFIFLGGLAGLIVSLGIMSASQWLLKTVFGLLGAYFVCSAFALARGAKKIHSRNSPTHP